MTQMMRPWSDAQERFMKLNAGKVAARTMAARFNRSEGAVRQKAQNLGLSLARAKRRARRRSSH